MNNKNNHLSAKARAYLRTIPEIFAIISNCPQTEALHGRLVGSCYFLRLVSYRKVVDSESNVDEYILMLFSHMIEDILSHVVVT